MEEMFHELLHREEITIFLFQHHDLLDKMQFLYTQVKVLPEQDEVVVLKNYKVLHHLLYVYNKVQL
jgi:hypothetical protein